MEKNDEKMNLPFIPEDMAEFHVTGAVAITTPYDIRLIFIHDDILKGQDMSDKRVRAVKNGKCEIIMPPKIAKIIGKLLIDEYEKLEEKNEE